MPRLRRAIAAAGLAGASLAVLAVPAVRASTARSPHPTAPCPGLDIPLNRWSELPGPPGPPLAFVAQFDQQPCTFVGTTSGGEVFRTVNGGSSWSHVATIQGAALQGLVTRSAAPGTAFLLASPQPSAAPASGPSGLYVSRDYGATFQPVSTFDGIAVTDVAVSPSDHQELFATTRPLRSPASALPGAAQPGRLYRSDDFGQSWLVVPAAAPLQADRVAVDAADPSVVYVASSEPDAGVWVSTNGGATFTPPAKAMDPGALDVSQLDGGGTRLDVATAGGIERTEDRGGTFGRVGGDRRYTALAHETYYPDALMAVIDGVASRSVDDGKTFRPVATGMPGLSGCATVTLSAGNESPSYFLLTAAGCAGAGSYLYRSDGRDLANLSSLSQSVPVPVVGAPLPRTPMRVLTHFRIPRRIADHDGSRGAGTSGSIASDGRHLYLTTNVAQNHVYVLGTDGSYQGVIDLPGWADVRSLTYDSTRDVLWTVVAYAKHKPTYTNRNGYTSGKYHADVYKLDLRTHRFTFAFPSPGGLEQSVSWDPSIQRFRAVQERGYGVEEIDAHGAVRSKCTVPGQPIDPNQAPSSDGPNPFRPGAPGLASGIETGDGGMYVQLEDDISLYRIDRSCHLLAVFAHRQFAESSGRALCASNGAQTLCDDFENDQLACDSVAFGQPAVWIRDSDTHQIFAYSVPAGYCPSPTTLALTPPNVRSAHGIATRICASLRVPYVSGAAGAVAGGSVRFLAGGRVAGIAPTSALGQACTTYTPKQRAGSTVPMAAVFLGDVSYRPSKAAGRLTLAPRVVVPKIVKPRPVPIPPIVVAPLALLPPLAPPAAPPAQPNPNPQPQPNPQTQPQGQAAFAPQRRTQHQLAAATLHDPAVAKQKEQAREEYAMVRATPGTSGAVDPSVLYAAAFAMCLGGGYVVRRRQQRGPAKARARAGRNFVIRPRSTRPPGFGPRGGRPW